MYMHDTGYIEAGLLMDTYNGDEQEGGERCGSSRTVLPSPSRGDFDPELAVEPSANTPTECTYVICNTFNKHGCILRESTE